MMKNTIAENVFIALVLVIFLVGFFMLLVFIDSYRCKSIYEDYGTKYKIVGGCFIEYKGKYTPVGKIQFNDLEVN
jgi:hypothetical protein